jgi:hypothetical protein
MANGAGRLFGSVGFLMAGAMAANAATIDIDGVWGDKHGCEWVRGNFDHDSAVVLRSDRLEGHEFQCLFKSAKKGKDGSFSIRGDCASEGTETIVQITVGPDRKGVRAITANKGWKFSSVSRCR